MNIHQYYCCIKNIILPSSSSLLLSVGESEDVLPHSGCDGYSMFDRTAGLLTAVAAAESSAAAGFTAAAGVVMVALAPGTNKLKRGTSY